MHPTHPSVAHVEIDTRRYLHISAQDAGDVDKFVAAMKVAREHGAELIIAPRGSANAVADGGGR